MSHDWLTVWTNRNIRLDHHGVVTQSLVELIMTVGAVTPGHQTQIIHNLGPVVNNLHYLQTSHTRH